MSDYPSAYDHLLMARQFMATASTLRAGSGPRDRVEYEANMREARDWEAQATAHATTAIAIMLVDQSVCGHGVLQVHNDQQEGSTCRP